MKVKWNSVKDKLPKDNQVVLTYSEFGVVNTCIFCTSTINNESIYILFPIQDENSLIRLERITHWMPLPDAPKD